MYVEVVDAYRSKFEYAGLEWMMHGNGYGKVIAMTESSDRLDGTSIPQFEIEWADGSVTVMAQTHVKPSNRKAFFNARLGNV